MKSTIPKTLALPKRLSLVAQTVQSLCDGIRAGHWKDCLPGERELCEHLQVSRRTLRAALEELQRKGWLSVAQRRRRRIKVRRAIHRASAQKKLIAVLSAQPFPALPSPLMFVMDTLRDKLTQADCLVEFHLNRPCFAAHPAHALAKLVDDHPATMWLVFGSKEPMQRWFIRQQLPCLVAGSCAPSVGLPSVDVDFRATCRHAGGVLLRRGHRQIALVLPQDAYGGDVLSEEGLREALSPLHKTAQLRMLRHDGTAAHLCFLLDDVLRSPNPPTAFLVARAPHALTTTMHLMRRGKRIPQDVAVISRDNDPFLESTTPTIARYAVNPTQFTRRLLMAVRELTETGTLPAHAIRLMPKFIAGETA